jgi:hypothetical protein
MSAGALIKSIVVISILAAATPAASRFNSRASESCPLIFPASPVVVAPNQPAVPARSTVGIINGLCAITLNFVNCGFMPTSVAINCDTNGDGVPELLIPLKNITIINQLLFQATLPALGTSPGTAFPLACCGGLATITLTCTLSAGDDNVFGPITQSLTCPIDLGLRAPLVISATPSEGDCVLGQNVLIPGACFLLADGKPNVTSVFGVEVGNPANVIQASTIQILTNNLVDAFFKPDPSNAGKTFLIFVSGPNGTSRNLTVLPPGAPAGCPLGNEQGTLVQFKCKGASTPDSGASGDSTTTAPAVGSCQIDRDEAGSFTLSIFGKRIRNDAIVTIGGKSPKKIKFRDADPADGTFTRITVKKKFCELLPGAIVITNQDGTSSAPMVCAQRCSTQ